MLAKRSDLFEFSEFTIDATLDRNFTKVIEKCSNILQFNENSSYVDEALMMLGKSFYYQKNYTKAIRKFEELVQNQPESPYVNEAKLWIAKVQFQSRQFSQGLSGLRKVRDAAIEAEDEELLRSTYIEEVKYLAYAEEYAAAVTVAESLLTILDDGAIQAFVVNKIGQYQIKMNNLDQAEKSFARVMDYSPAFDTEFAAIMNLGKVKRDLGKTDEALELFNELNRLDKYRDSKPAILIQLGKTHRTLGDYESAYYDFLMVDTGYANTPQVGNARYEMAEMYERDVRNFDSASVFYAKAKSSQATDEYIDLIRERTRLFNKYESVNGILSGYRKQYFYLMNPEEFKKDSLEYYADSLKAAKERELLTLFGTTIDTTKPIDTLLVFSDTARLVLSNELALLGYDTLQIKDSIQSVIVFKIDSLRKAAIQKGNAAIIPTQDPKQQTGNMPTDQTKKKSPPVFPTISEDSLKTLLAKNSLEMGNLFFIEMNMPDSAQYYYSRITEEYPATSVYEEGVFALASYYSTVDSTELSDSLFNVIYTTSSNNRLVNAAAQKLGKPRVDLKPDPAIAVLKKGEDETEAKEYKKAVSTYYSVYTLHPSSQYVPRALYSAGYVLENYLVWNDSAAAVYDTLLRVFPRHEFSGRVSSKMAFYRQEKARIEKERLDSLKAIEDAKKALADSLEAARLLKLEKQKDSTGTISQDSLQMHDSLHIKENTLPELKDSSISPADSSWMFPQEEGGEKDTLKNQKQEGESQGVWFRRKYAPDGEANRPQYALVWCRPRLTANYAA